MLFARPTTWSSSPTNCFLIWGEFFFSSQKSLTDTYVYIFYYVFELYSTIKLLIIHLTCLFSYVNVIYWVRSLFFYYNPNRNDEHPRPRDKQNVDLVLHLCSPQTTVICRSEAQRLQQSNSLLASEYIELAEFLENVFALWVETCFLISFVKCYFRYRVCDVKLTRHGQGEGEVFTIEDRIASLQKLEAYFEKVVFYQSFNQQILNCVFSSRDLLLRRW